MGTAFPAAANDDPWNQHPSAPPVERSVLVRLAPAIDGSRDRPVGDLEPGVDIEVRVRPLHVLI